MAEDVKHLCIISRNKDKFHKFSLKHDGRDHTDYRGTFRLSAKCPFTLPKVAGGRIQISHLYASL